MKNFITFFGLTMLPLLLSTFAAGAENEVEIQPRLKLKTENREWFVIVSGGISDDLRAKAKYRFYDLLKTTTIGDVVHLLAATPEHRHLASGDIPDRPKLTRLRSRELQKVSGAIASFFKTKNIKQAAPENSQLDLFRTGTTVAQLRKTDFPVCIVFVGSPIYHDSSRHLGLSMLNGKVLTLATLRDDPLSHTSVFYQGVTKLPPNTQISILSEQKWGVDSIHEGEITKYLRTFFWLNGEARLQKITDSAAAAFDLQKPQPVKVGTKFYPMLPGYNVKDYPSEWGVRDATVDSVQEDTPEHGPRVVIHGGHRAKPPAVVAAPAEVDAIIEECYQSQTETALCLRWKPDSDFTEPTDNDWYLVHPNHREVLSFKQPKTPFARLRNDMMFGSTTPTGDFTNNWEVVTVKNGAIAAGLEVWVDTYKGRGTIPCNIMLVGNGKKIPLTFDLPNHRGDRGSGFDNREKHSSWRRVNLPNNWQTTPTVRKASKPVPIPPSPTSTSAVSRNQPAPSLLTTIVGHYVGRAITEPPALLNDILIGTNSALSFLDSAWGELANHASKAALPVAAIERVARIEEAATPTSTASFSSPPGKANLSFAGNQGGAVSSPSSSTAPQPPSEILHLESHPVLLSPVPIEMHDPCFCYPSY